MFWFCRLCSVPFGAPVFQVAFAGSMPTLGVMAVKCCEAIPLVGLDESSCEELGASKDVRMLQNQ